MVLVLKYSSLDTLDNTCYRVAASTNNQTVNSCLNVLTIVRTKLLCFFQEFVAIVSAKRPYFHGLAEYHEGLACKDEVKYGEAVARFRVSNRQSLTGHYWTACLSPLDGISWHECSYQTRWTIFHSRSKSAIRDKLAQPIILPTFVYIKGCVFAHPTWPWPNGDRQRGHLRWRHPWPFKVGRDWPGRSCQADDAHISCFSAPGFVCECWSGDCTWCVCNVWVEEGGSHWAGRETGTSITGADRVWIDGCVDLLRLYCIVLSWWRKDRTHGHCVGVLYIRCCYWRSWDTRVLTLDSMNLLQTLIIQVKNTVLLSPWQQWQNCAGPRYWEQRGAWESQLFFVLWLLSDWLNTTRMIGWMIPLGTSLNDIDDDDDFIYTGELFSLMSDLPQSPANYKHICKKL